MTGGSNFWSSQAENYETNWVSQTLKDMTVNSGFSMKEIAVLNNESMFELQCLMPAQQIRSQRYEIKLIQK